ncbi:MAG: aldehyde dehydrogenase family protein [Pseudomonadota bacterium]
MQISESEIQSIVRKVVERIGQQADPSISQRRAEGPRRHQMGVFDQMDPAVAAAEQAQQALLGLSLDHRKKIIESVRRLCHEYVVELAEAAVRETGLGRVDDKIKKNRLVIDKTPGPEILEPWTYTGDDGMTLHERGPMGVLAAVTPCTNPSETVICNAIGMISAGDSVIFNPHPLAKAVSARTVELINEAVVAVGGPANLVCCMKDPTIESAQALMRHPEVRMVVVTVGPGVVAEAMRCGKKVIGAGPGNPPVVVVDETADLDVAGKGIVLGASLDNNIVCIAEKEIIAVDSIADDLKKSMAHYGGYEVAEHQRRKLETLLLAKDGPKKEWIGKDAVKILAEIGVNAGPEIRLVFCETDKNHPFAQFEMLLPVIPLIRVKSAHEGIVLAKELEHGYRHTAVMYSRNIEHLHEMARLIDTSIFVKNAPSYAGLGLGGEGYTSFTIAGPTGEGLTTAINFTRERRCTLAGHFRIV